MARRLTLAREILTELTAADLVGVVGGAPDLPTLNADCATRLVKCITDADHRTCLNCE